MYGFVFASYLYFQNVLQEQPTADEFSERLRRNLRSPVFRFRFKEVRGPYTTMTFPRLKRASNRTENVGGSDLGPNR